MSPNPAVNTSVTTRRQRTSVPWEFISWGKEDVRCVCIMYEQASTPPLSSNVDGRLTEWFVASRKRHFHLINVVLPYI